MRLIDWFEDSPLTELQRAAVEDAMDELDRLRRAARTAAQSIRAARCMYGRESFAGVTLLAAASDLEAAAGPSQGGHP